MSNFLRGLFNQQTLNSCFSAKYLRFNLILFILMLINAILIIILSDFLPVHVFNIALFVSLVVNAVYIVHKLKIYWRRQE